MDIILIQDKTRNGGDMEKLLNLWQQSVEATHDFLSKENIVSLIDAVKEGLKGIDILLIAKDNNNINGDDDDDILGFMGIENNKIEMLFINPTYFGKGIGKKLISHAILQYKIKYVDVNEQNTKALGFYKHMGFTTFNRSELDPQGNPFPILNLQLE